MDWSAIISRWRSHATLRVLGLILLGQLVSFSIALMSLSSSLIAQLGVDAPLTQSLSTYASLALVYGSILLYRHHKPLVSWYWYLLLGFVDVQGNYLVNKAYQYTSITSVTLLDCWTIPWVLILTWIFLGTRYSLWQLSGAALCVLGLCLVILSDTWVGGGGGSRPILGDVLVIAGTLFYGISNVGEEFCVKRKDQVEVVSMLGLYGFLVTIVEVSVIELKTLESVKWSTDIVLAFVGYALSSFMLYTFAPFVLKVDWLYFLSFALVVIGLIVYSATEKDTAIPAPATEDGNLNTQYQMLHDESTVSENGSFAS
ncbi:uncharacterized protein LOC133286829 isoform X2 [Gastrolobium bilobum]|uniref:uncharacterized protein LOC133286829 isoform X2 n=1 Tax=Gastrolobium bilobum TaxID=150636 RepID=UPI002AB00B42|nr:uncharacterized protein LOC133286829 isoform X2 [Gastrolobium bilobum]